MSPLDAPMIAPDKSFDGAPLLRREFSLDASHGAVTTARLRVSALGICEPTLNGTPVSGDLLTPGWTSYEWRLRYAEYEVQQLLQDRSVIGIALGNGWYKGRLGWTGGGEFYGQEVAAIAELRIRFEDGHEQIVTTDQQWTAGPSATTANDLYDGQIIDARRIDHSWSRPGFNDEGWIGVHQVEYDPAKIEPYIGPPVVRQERLSPEQIWTSPNGATLLDFGQNIVGWINLKVKGEPGAVITLRHAEVLENGELGTRPLRTAQAKDEFILSGQHDDFEPTMTFHGFRYAQVDGWREEYGNLAEAATAVVIGSDMKRIGRLETSDPLLNRFHENVVWGMRGNFVDVPTDCPQRDERLGWTGDIAVFAPTAAFLFDSEKFLRDWLADLKLEQRHNNGVVPFVVPDVIKHFDLRGNIVGEWVASGAPTAAWSDAAVWVPWALWEAYGNPTVLVDHFDSMAAHVRCIRGSLSSNGVWDQGFQFGDWLDPDAPPHDAFAAKADPGVVATACAYRSALLTAKAAAVLGRLEEQVEFDSLAVGLREAFNSRYVTGGTVHSDCTTVYSIAIVFGLLNEDDKEAAGARLAELVQDSQFRVSTGFVGTPYITDALTETGNIDLAYRLLLEKGCPSWLYPVTMGATTVWERWDSMLPDGTINAGEMTSFNHYALGSVADWMHRTIGGIAPTAPGYESVLIAPKPGGGLTWATSSLETSRGTIAVRWELLDDELAIQVTMPPNTEAVLRLQNLPDAALEEGTSHHRVPWRDLSSTQPFRA